MLTELDAANALRTLSRLQAPTARRHPPRTAALGAAVRAAVTTYRREAQRGSSARA